MEFLNQAITNQNSFCRCDRSGATHFRDPNTGDIRPIAELIDGVVDNTAMVLNVPREPSDELPDPLPLPTMNFGDADEQPVVGDVLPLPVMNFDPPGKKHKSKARAVNNTGLPEPLPLPDLMA